MDWLKPFMHKHPTRRATCCSARATTPTRCSTSSSGTCRINEIDVELHPGQLVGELGFLTPEHERTQSVECTEDVEMLTITYDKLSELYFQNPTFGFYFLQADQRTAVAEHETAGAGTGKPAQSRDGIVAWVTLAINL